MPVLVPSLLDEAEPFPDDPEPESSELLVDVEFVVAAAGE
jgi:hypothetical protein